MSTNSAAQVVMLLGTDNNDGTFTGATTGRSGILPPDDHTLSSFAVIGNGTITGGTVLIEEAYCSAQGGSPYGGTWSVIATIDATTLTGTKQQAYHIAPNALFSRRIRISSTITGGGGISVAARVQ